VGVERKIERAKLFQELIKDMITPAKIPFWMIGSVTEKKVPEVRHPRSSPRSSKDGSKFRRPSGNGHNGEWEGHDEDRMAND